LATQPTLLSKDCLYGHRPVYKFDHPTTPSLSG